MLFSSYEFLVLFFPVTLLGYFLINRLGPIGLGRLWLLVMSLTYYGWWNINYVPLILGTILFNYVVSLALMRRHAQNRPTGLWLAFGVSANLALLGYYKYANFFLDNVIGAAGGRFDVLHIALPLGISFYTFQIIAHLADSAQGKVKDTDILNYALFVLFFPQLIAGPIVHHKEMMPQFDELRNRRVRLENLASGLFIFSIGLFKKVVLADQLAVYADSGWDNMDSITTLSAAITMLAFTFQIYFDFSAYSDMAIGCGRMLNINLPINFKSPYKARNMAEFWRRWHMTLGRFLFDYLYKPLGGGRYGWLFTGRNVLIVFFLGGLWHGAAWTFVVWGLLNGLAVAAAHIWGRFARPLPFVIAWGLTFSFTVVAWSYFRAPTLSDGWAMIAALFGANGIVVTETFAFTGLPVAPVGGGFVSLSSPMLMILLCATIAFFTPNSIELLERFRPNALRLVWAASSFILGFLYVDTTRSFLYWVF